MTTNTVFPFTGETLKWADLPPDIFVLLSEEFNRRATEAYDKVQQYELVEGQEDAIAAAYNEGKFDAFFAASLLMDSAPKPDGWNVWVAEDAPAFKSWRKVAWFGWMPEGNILGQMNEHCFDGSALWLGDDGNWFAHIGKRIVRRYRVLPADVTPDEAVQT